MRNGVTTAQVATHRNHRDVSSLPLRHSQAPHSASSGTSEPEVGHHAHRPVLDEHVRDVVARPVLLLVLRLQLVEARRPGRPRCRSPAATAGAGSAMIFVGVSSLLAAADLEHRERARLAGLPLRLRRRDLHRLVLGLDHAELAADQRGSGSTPGAARPAPAWPCARTARGCSPCAGATPRPPASPARR